MVGCPKAVMPKRIKLNMLIATMLLQPLTKFPFGPKSTFVRPTSASRPTSHSYNFYFPFCSARGKYKKLYRSAECSKNNNSNNKKNIREKKEKNSETENTRALTKEKEKKSPLFTDEYSIVHDSWLIVGCLCGLYG